MMKRLLTILFLFLSVCIYSQTTTRADKIIANDSLKVAGNAIGKISTDTLLTDNSNYELVTQKAIKTYVSHNSIGSGILSSDNKWFGSNSYPYVRLRNYYDTTVYATLGYLDDGSTGHDNGAIYLPSILNRGLLGKRDTVAYRSWVRDSISSSLDTTSLSNRINLRVKYTDSASMLAAYQTAINTNTANILLRVKYTDTATMLTAYQSAILSRVKYTDTSSMLAAYASSLNGKVKFTDTASMLTAYQTALNNRIKYSDSTKYITPTYFNANKGISLSAISATTPMTFNTSTGVIAIGQSTTSTNGYLSSTDWNRFDGKLNISDTLTMLNNRISAITLNSSGVIHNSPINFVRSGGGWVGSMSLVTQSAYKVFWNNTNASATPNWYSLDSNAFGGNFAGQVRNTFSATRNVSTGSIFTYNSSAGVYNLDTTKYQQPLVSGTNIKTVNSNSLLGSGDVSVGTVTSVATGFGLTGGTITTTGTLKVDSAAVPTVTQTFSPIITLTDGATITWDATYGCNAKVTLSGTGRTLTISNAVAGRTYHLDIYQDGTGSRTITTYTNLISPAGVIPALTTTANARDEICMFYDGSKFTAIWLLNVK